MRRGSSPGTASSGAAASWGEVQGTGFPGFGKGLEGLGSGLGFHREIAEGGFGAQIGCFGVHTGGFGVQIGGFVVGFPWRGEERGTRETEGSFGGVGF